MLRTGIVWDQRYLQHETGPRHPESPQRLLSIKEVLDSDSKLIHLSPRLATRDELAWVHHQDHIFAVENTRGREDGYFDGDTPYSAGSADAAFLAAGGVIEAVKAVESGRVDNAFAFPRPPGHHAEAHGIMGFCLFNNVAVAAEYLIRQKNKSRIAIVDIDVHHGNGTQHIFYDRDDVFYVSVHRFPFYPGTGAMDERGEGRGYGTTLNRPLPELSDDDDYEKEFDQSITRALLDYHPEFVLVSAGFDAHARDPLGGMRVTQKGFKMMSQRLFEIARKCCEGKIVFVLEGGYDMKGLQEGVGAVLQVLRSA